jgi:two-component system, OmpR family, KDP operon response regulator KdpE
MPAHRPRILVVDDEPQIHRFLGPALEANGYEAIRAMTAAEGLAVLYQRPPEAMILDLGLPDRDGQDVLVEARTLYQGPILILSARDRETEKIEALDRGADDYVEKPFGIGELLARLRAALRHTIARSGVSSTVRSGELEIDLVNRRVVREGQAVRLSPREYDLLAKLVEGGGKVVTHRQLLTSVWGPAHVDDVAYLRVFVGHLRQKLELDPATPHRIVTEPGVGYRFIAD